MNAASIRSACLAAALAVTHVLSQAAPTTKPSVYLEELTSPELRERLATGTTTVLIPIGGTEQNGPHMVLGKHNVRVRLLAGRIAEALGNAVVAPVMAYVPEGSIHPPAAHMRFTGTISIPEATFEQVLEGAANSFRQHGFREVVFIGDHGGYQKSEVRVADRLNKAWGPHPDCHVIALLDYYRASDVDYANDLQARGYPKQEIGSHAGLADTSLTLALDKDLVRTDKLQQPPKAEQGVHGDPRRATAELGQIGVQHIVASSVAAIRAATRDH
jgi:creatinine amidohydrolase/Fe(II)-dependent formamide hydrolase-like protein